MKLKIYSDPLLLDFIKICAALPEDERKQIEAFSGHAYDIDGAAVGNFMVAGPKWVAKDENDQPVAIGGFVEQRPGVYRDFLLSTPDAWSKYWFQLTRICRRVMDGMLHNGVHRLECVVPANRLSSRAELARWYKVLGYNKESLHYGYCADGTDAVMFSRVRH